ncbi:M16 family metallopeptidase [Cognatazoarcus halotolerans]|uniref:M16 family metallopeptidase n=1 Tax=Cognatazoarcus halotolerans TaxID=2686016 RepID=UPI00135866EA|nr:pitrilysin family protein [Cognatazoarcus halotolerans]MBX3680160.1 insulinase family protein [Rhodocyclaceae bacterium]MCB1897777.1 insulinase family protein [Rhodocyclaceae bacterium]MCP5309755.1 insulinase family protein [Zoogloeaceae bacterium]
MKLVQRIARVSAFVVAFGAAGVANAAVDIQHWQSASGARVYFVESRSLPIVDVQIDFAAGSVLDPADKAGLASLASSLIDRGAGALDEDAIADRLADVGAELSGGAEMDRASFSLRSLSSKEELDAAVGLMATVLAQPTFPAAIVERERGRSIAGLKEALTQPDTIAGRLFLKGIYGDHPYGSAATPESLARITRDDVVDFHKRYFVTSGASIAIVGDLDRAGAEKLADRITAGLAKGDAPAATPPVVEPKQARLVAPHPSAQAHVLIGLPGLKRDDPDYYPLLVGNYVLGGGGFVSRLMHEVREKRGFAYSVYSYFEPRRELGPFQIGLQTKGSQTDEAIKVVDQTLQGFLDEGPSKEELAAARDNIVNGFGLRLDSNRKILGYVSVIGFFGLPLDWLEQYPKAVEKVTAEAVRDAFRRRVRPENLITVIVGGSGDQAQATKAQ